MNSYSFRLTEEIARYAFEVALEQTSWEIAYTNPSAGPWKIVQGMDRSGRWGEVYRFAREEERPDIVLFNDDLRIIIIIEAKDSLVKLLDSNQVTKSANVVLSLSDILISKGDHPFWGQRANYTVVAGFLWGSKKKTGAVSRQQLFDAYRTALGVGVHSSVLLGIESWYDKDTDSIKCFGYVSNQGLVCPGLPANDLLHSLPVE